MLSHFEEIYSIYERSVEIVNDLCSCEPITEKVELKIESDDAGLVYSFKLISNVSPLSFIGRIEDFYLVILALSGRAEESLTIVLEKLEEIKNSKSRTVSSSFDSELYSEVTSLLKTCIHYQHLYSMGNDEVDYIREGMYERSFKYSNSI